MQTHGSSIWLMRESRQRLRRMICQMTMQELREQMAGRKRPGQRPWVRTPGQIRAQAVRRGMKRGLPAGMVPCQRTAAALQKMSAKL